MKIFWLLLMTRALFVTGEEGGNSCFCRLNGQLDDCPCSAETVDVYNSQNVHGPLNDLLASYYFRYFQVDFSKPCTFFPDDDGRCSNRNCGVKTCVKGEVPEAFKNMERLKHESNADTGLLDSVLDKVYDVFPVLKDYKDMAKEAVYEWLGWEVTECREENDDDEEEEVHPEYHKVDTNIENKEDAAKLNEFCALDPLESETCEFIDLVLNEEKFTGYRGKSSWRIWSTIYNELCFHPENESHTMELNSQSVKELCLEKRAFYRIVSGLHSSITVHLCKNYLLQEANVLRGLPPVWGPNYEEFQRRFSAETTGGEGPERLKNMFFLYLVELRAIAKAAPLLQKLDFDSGDQETDRGLKKTLTIVLEAAKLFPDPFDEQKLFKEEQLEHSSLAKQFKEKFYKISQIMDCMGCERCKVWGKLQVTGIGTALKILLTPEDSLTLTRHEIVALFNAFGRISTSLREMELFRNS